MANSYTLLANLKNGCCSNTAEVRYLRFWEARNIRKGGELMSVDMLFLDERKQSMLILGTMNATRSHTYRPYLSEGSIYSLSGFEVTQSNNNFRLSDAPACLHSLQRWHNIRRTYDQLLALANHQTTTIFYLIFDGTEFLNVEDVFGEITVIHSTISDGIHRSQRVMLTLRVERGLNVCISLFDGLAYSFHDKMTSYGVEPKVLLVTSINPKVVGAEKKYPKARFDIRKQATLAYQRSVNAHGNVLMNLVANKRSKEDVESKPKSQEHSNCQPLPINFNKVSNFHLKIKNPPKKLHSEWSLPEVDGIKRIKRINRTLSNQTNKNYYIRKISQRIDRDDGEIEESTENRQRRWRDQAWRRKRKMEFSHETDDEGKRLSNRKLTPILGVVVCDMKNAITIVASVREISSKTAKMKT
ncbi:unnamed protein product [Brassica oleracea]